MSIVLGDTGVKSDPKGLRADRVIADHLAHVFERGLTAANLQQELERERREAEASKQLWRTR